LSSKTKWEHKTLFNPKKKGDPGRRIRGATRKAKVQFCENSKWREKLSRIKGGKVKGKAFSVG